MEVPTLFPSLFGRIQHLIRHVLDTDGHQAFAIDRGFREGRKAQAINTFGLGLQGIGSFIRMSFISVAYLKLVLSGLESEVVQLPHLEANESGVNEIDLLAIHGLALVS